MSWGAQDHVRVVQPPIEDDVLKDDDVGATLS